MRKVIIIGSPGAGKSNFARKLHKATGLSLYHLDMIWHKPDKTNYTREEFDQRLAEIMQQEEWIIDGNYSRTLEIRLKACDTVFLLDFPKDHLPEIYRLLDKYKEIVNVIIFKTREESESYLCNT